ncbi:hypothetical protein GS937_03385 [Rhodococcus hoagii]|nr:hypothetical protein [Prescottella equi]
MSENSLEHTEVPQDTARSTLREAERIWRRAAVRPSDRRALLAELSDELAAAGADGLTPSAIVGDDSEDTLRAWADERGLSGRALRLGIVVPVGLLGVAGGFALLLPILVIGFSPDTVTIEPMELIFGLYAMTGLLAYLLAVTGTFAALRQAGDPRSGSTARGLLPPCPPAPRWRPQWASGSRAFSVSLPNRRPSSQSSRPSAWYSPRRLPWPATWPHAPERRASSAPRQPDPHRRR